MHMMMTPRMMNTMMDTNIYIEMHMMAAPRMMDMMMASRIVHVGAYDGAMYNALDIY